MTARARLAAAAVSPAYMPWYSDIVVTCRRLSAAESEASRQSLLHDAPDNNLANALIREFVASQTHSSAAAAALPGTASVPEQPHAESASAAESVPGDDEAHLATQFRSHPLEADPPDTQDNEQIDEPPTATRRALQVGFLCKFLCSCTQKRVQMAVCTLLALQSWLVFT